MFDLFFTIPLEDCTYSNVDMYMVYKYIEFLVLSPRHRFPSNGSEKGTKTKTIH